MDANHSVRRLQRDYTRMNQAIKRAQAPFEPADDRRRVRLRAAMEVTHGCRAARQSAAALGRVFEQLAAVIRRQPAVPGAVDEQHRRARARQRGNDVGVGPAETRDAASFWCAAANCRSVMPLASLAKAARMSSGTALSADENGSNATTVATRLSRPAVSSATEPPYEMPSRPTRETSQPRRCRSSSTCDRSRDSKAPKEMWSPVEAP